ncbi:DUF1367 family protein [Pseudochrobactrum sp. AO18b]|uniref:DUF1367 family protein n=1 Tax=Pseudochrobactrum sp. AO18b TaxID=1201036 RepID=UPI0003A3EE7B|nr:DUF1367 family protein [Pseudochrobactrum sp. AO18b]
MSKKDKPIYGFIRLGNALVPAMNYDLAALESIAQGELVKVEIKQFRNVGRHRAYWAMLQEVIDACGLDYNAEKLHDLIKLHNGVIDFITLPSGLTVSIPASISFDKMSETDFQTFFRKAETWLAKTYGYFRQEAA